MAYERPGCFGHAVTFNKNSPACKDCDEMEPCAKQALLRLEELRSVMNVDAIVRMAHSHKAKEVPQIRFDSDLPEAARKLIAMLPENAQRVAATLVRTKLNYRKLLLSGMNPIANRSPLSISVLFDMLIQGDVSKDDYLLLLKEKLGHSPSVAIDQASIAYAVVTGLGIAVLENDSLIIRKDK